MAFMVKEKMEDDLAMLIYGQKYQLKTLISACIDAARRLSLKELKQHKEEIEPDNYLLIAEGIIQRLETQCDEVREGSLKCLALVCQNLYWHDREKDNSRAPDTDVVLNRLLKDVDKSSGDVVCHSLNCVAEELMAQKKILETLPSFQRKNTLDLSGLRRLRR